MNEYLELKEKHQKEIDAFPIYFAFNNEQFAEILVKMNVKKEDAPAKLNSVIGGGFLLKTDAPKLDAMFQKHTKERNAAIANDKTGEGYIFDMFNYELSNHEYCITGDLTDTLESVGLTINEINESKALLHGLKQAQAYQND